MRCGAVCYGGAATHLPVGRGAIVVEVGRYDQLQGIPHLFWLGCFFDCGGRERRVYGMVFFES